MNQINIGNFIAKKRKELNMTQAQFAEKLGVSNKTIPKWETGKCMPDYSIIQELCKELNVSVAELIEMARKTQQISHVTNMVTRFSRAVLGFNRLSRDNGTELKGKLILKGTDWNITDLIKQ